MSLIFSLSYQFYEKKVIKMKEFQKNRRIIVLV